MRFDTFLEFLREYFRGSTGQAEHREMFICRGDPATAKVKDRGVVWVDGISGYISSYIKSIEKIKKWNIYMGVGFVVEYLTTPLVDKMLYDRIAFDLDYDVYKQAVSHALNFAKHINEKYDATPLVFESGFKGAHVVIPLSQPIDWGTYQLLWRKLYGEMMPEARGMVDMNMLQWNRLDRVPLTYNVKDSVRFARIIYPKEFNWQDFSWAELKPLDPSRIRLVKVITPQIVKPRIIAKSREMSWVWKVVKKGLPDGRKRFILYVLIPYLVNINNKSEEEVLETCREFLDNSCKNHGNCGKIYDSWIRSVMRSSRTHRFRGFGLSKLKEKDQELYTLIYEALR